MPHGFETLNDIKKISLKNKWLSVTPHQKVIKGQPLDQTIQSIKTLEDNSIFSNEIIVAYCIRDLMPVYASKNVEKILGYTQEEFLGWEDGAFFKIGAVGQPTFYPNYLEWEGIFISNCPHQKAQTRGRSHMGGVKFLHKDGSVRTFLMRQEFVLGENFGLPEYDYLYLEDVSHLVRGDDYWVLMETFFEDETYSKFHRKEGVENSPITNREQEILVLISEGKSTKEVAAELHISPDTVSQHRKNMTKKMMARDTSALVQLCKKCQII